MLNAKVKCCHKIEFVNYNLLLYSLLSNSSDFQLLFTECSGYPLSKQNYIEPTKTSKDGSIGSTLAWGSYDRSSNPSEEEFILTMK